MSLDPDPETMRRIGYRVVDRIVAHASGIRATRVATPPDPARLDRAVAEPLPRSGHGIEDSVDRYFDELMPLATQVAHPRFFAYIPGPGSFAGAVGGWMAAATNCFVGTWLGGAVMTRLELEVHDWLRRALGLPAALGTGLITSGGSMANFTALAAARTRAADPARAAVYTSAEAHYSVAKAARLLGFRSARIRAVPVDGTLAMDPRALAGIVEADRRDGIEPLAVVATAGTTNTGAIDPLPALADLCAAEDLWLHVDAAYGAGVALLDEGRRWLRGWERADSITVDPHKWLYVPFECGCVLTRHTDALERAFEADGSYMQDIPREQVNFFARGPELTRGNRALKLWMVLRSHGTEALADCVRRDLELCRIAARLLGEDPRVELVTPPRLSMFSFAVDGGEEAGTALFERLLADGFTMLSTSRVDGRFVLRFCVVNHRTTERDVRESVARIRELL